MKILQIQLDDKAEAEIADLKKRAGNITDVELFMRALATFDVCLTAEAQPGGLTINGQPLKLT